MKPTHLSSLAMVTLKSLEFDHLLGVINKPLL
jgi:hypothetical protein